MKYIPIVLTLILFQNCTSNFENNNLKSNKILPNDIRWVVKSKEYDAICEQTYKNAWNNLSYVLSQSDSLSCIVMDLDETILDNSEYQIKLIENNEKFNQDNWSRWVKLEEAKLIPGAKNFIDKVRESQINIVFLSNRMIENERATIENMKKLNIYQKDDIFLLRKDKSDKKHKRRQEIIDGTNRMKNIGPLKVLAYFGDAWHDFPESDNYYMFGQNMFMFPNPMYGKW